jgi:catechol 2,3-dioxygenase-like lactoylglutathione lyase family enzyme
MDRTLTAILDHVAIAVRDPAAAETRWVEQLGGGLVAKGSDGVFRSRQLRFAGGGKLELLSPHRRAEGRDFVTAYLDRFGSRIHHVTLKVPDLAAAIATIRAAGLDVVDVDDGDPTWQEGFLRPSQVGGLIVQLAASTQTDEEWAAQVGVTPVPPRGDAARLHGPTLRHPDLDRAAALWTLLGATVAPDGDALRCTWPDSPLDVLVVPGEPAGPTVLRCSDAPALPADEALGPEVVTV